MSLPAILLAILLLHPAVASAWGPNGHRIVGEIAESHLSAEAARAVAALIGPENLAQASLWADQIRADPSWSHAETWHYIDIDDGETFETAERHPRGDVVKALQRFEAVLRDPRSAHAERATAIKFLAHFVGDLHQPVHVGRHDDRGGNDIEVRWLGEPTNLHHVWDHELIDSEGLSFKEFAASIGDADAEQTAQWQASTCVDWAKESFALRRQVYDFKNLDLSQEYARANRPLVRRRLHQAGVRLAGLLNSIFAEP